jgi:transcriptional regulator GlxA family with amidase domain
VKRDYHPDGLVRLAELQDMDARVRKVMDRMYQLLGEDVSIRDFSKGVNLSPSRLRELFKEETGRSPIQYLRDLRMEHAAKLLGGTFLSVKEVAFNSGAQDVSHFVRDFKKRFGLTPSEYRGQRPSPMDSELMRDSGGD